MQRVSLSSLWLNPDERQEKLPRGATKAHKAMVTIKRFRSLVLGINRDRENGKLGAPRPDHGVPEQHAAKPVPAVRLVNGEPPKAGGRNGRIAR